MSVFLDSGYFIAYADKRDYNHKAAVALSEKLSNGELGTIYTSDYIFDEVVTYTLVRTKDSAKAIELGKHILNSEIQLVAVTQEVFNYSWKIFQQRKNISFTDCTIVSAMAASNIKNLVTFDKGFNQFKKEINVLK